MSNYQAVINADKSCGAPASAELPTAATAPSAPQRALPTCAACLHRFLPAPLLFCCCSLRISLPNAIRYVTRGEREGEINMHVTA